MKWILPLIIAVVFTACDQSVKGRNGEIYRSATDYNNYIIERQKKVSGYIISFYSQLNKNPDSARIVLEKGLAFANKSLDEIKNMPSYKDDSSFRHSAINSFVFYKRLFESDYLVILSLHNKGAGITENDPQAEQKILDKIIKDEDQIDKDLHNRQRDFAEKNHMKLAKEEEEK
jgi:hypothetical protein